MSTTGKSTRDRLLKNYFQEGAVTPSVLYTTWFKEFSFDTSEVYFDKDGDIKGSTVRDVYVGEVHRLSCIY